MDQDEELHAELMAAFRKYFEANQQWMATGTKRACTQTRLWMSEIRRICSERRIELQKWRHWKNEDMKQQKAKKKAQNRKAPGTNVDNQC